MKKPDFQNMPISLRGETHPCVGGILTRDMRVKLVSHQEVILAEDTPVLIYLIGSKRVANYSGNFFEIREGEFLLAA